MRTPIRQGDVLLLPVDKLPSGRRHDYHQLTLAHGEESGHHHTLYATSILSKVGEMVVNDKRFIELDVEWLLRHQEHKELRVPPGCYEIIIEIEHDPFERAMRRVVD